MLMTKLKWTSLVVLTIGVLFTSAAVSAQFLRAEPGVPEQVAEPTRETPKNNAESAQVETRQEKPPKEIMNDTRVRALLKERLVVAREIADTMKKQLGINGVKDGGFGIVTLDDLQQAYLRLFKAELELCDTDKERLEVLEKTVGEWKTFEAWVAQRPGGSPAIDKLVLRSNRLDAEITLERAKAKIASPSK